MFHKPVVNLAFNETCPLKYKECFPKRPLSGKVVRSFEIQVEKATNGQKNSSAEETVSALPDLTS